MRFSPDGEVKQFPQPKQFGCRHLESAATFIMAVEKQVRCHGKVGHIPWADCPEMEQNWFGMGQGVRSVFSCDWKFAPYIACVTATLGSATGRFDFASAHGVEPFLVELPAMSHRYM